MGLCSKRFGYQSPAVGCWTIAISLELALGILMVLIGYTGDSLKEVLEQENLYTRKYDILLYVGIGHVVLAIAVAVVVALGLFISSCFLLPLCIISIVLNVFLVGTAIMCGVFVWPFSQTIRNVVFHDDVPIPAREDQFFSRLNGGYLITCACLALGGLAAYGRASSMKNDTPIPEAQLYVPCAVMLVSSATIFAIGGGGVGYSITLATIWYGLGLGMALLMNLANWCCTPKVFNIVVGAGFGCVAVFGLISCGLTANTYKTCLKEYRMFNFRPDVALVPQPLSEDWKLFVVMDGGRWLLAVSCTSLATAVLAFYSACYALRSVLFCFGKGDTS